MWDYVCPRCQEDVPKNSHECPRCGERYPMPLKLPPFLLKDRKALEDYVHRHVFPKVSQAHREYLAQFFTVLFSDGFESRDFSAWTSTSSNQSGQPTVQSSVVHHGTYAMQCSLNQGGYNAYAWKDFSSAGTVYARVYLRFNKVPSASESYQRLLMVYRVSDGFGGLELRIVSDGAGGAIFRVWNNYFGSGYDGAAAQVGTWYCVETLNLQSGTQRWWIDGAEQPTAGNGAVAMDRIRVGCYHVGGSSSVVIQFDCVVVADAYIGVEEEASLVEVADSLGLSDSVLRDKGLLPISDSLGVLDVVLRHKLAVAVADSVGVADALLRDKSFTVADSVGASDMVLGNKTLNITDFIALTETIKALKTLMITDQIQLAELLDVIKGGILKSVADSVGLVDSVVLNKILNIADSIALLDSFSRPSRVLQALDSVGLADGAAVDKILRVTDAINLAEVAEVGVGGVKKTRLFLIIGDLAVQLTGD